MPHRTVCPWGDEVFEGAGGQPPTRLTLPHWLLKGMHPTSAAARKAAMVRKDQPLIAGASHVHVTLEWVLRRLLRCPIRRNGEKTKTPGSGTVSEEARGPGALSPARPSAECQKAAASGR